MPVSRDDIQAEAIAAIDREREAGRRSTLVQMPTQTGKTRTSVKYARKAIDERNARILVLADRGELLNQWAGEFDRFGLQYVVEKAEQRALDKMVGFPEIRVCLGSKDSFQKRRLESWPSYWFTDVFLDECDLAVAETWQRVQKHFDGFRIGLTATIDRLDGVPLSTVFDSTAYVYRIEDAIRNGHRVPFKSVAMDIDIDIRDLKPNRTGSFAQGELAARIGPKLETIANACRAHLDRLNVTKAIAFLPGGKDCWAAYSFAEILTQIGVPAAGVHGQNKARDSIVSDFRAGRYRVLCNTSLFGRGFNDPAIEAVIHLNPTTSRALYDQRSGRCGATRDGKEYGYLLFPCWTTDLELAGPTDIFAGDADPKVRAVAKRLARVAKDDADPQALIDKAREIVAADARREAKRLAYEARRKEIRHKYREFDPLRIAGPWIRGEASDDAGGMLRTDYARELQDIGFRDTTGITNSTAPDMIRFWRERADCGMSTYKQMRYLTEQRRVPLSRVMNLSAKEASSLIGQLHTQRPACSR